MWLLKVELIATRYSSQAMVPLTISPRRAFYCLQLFYICFILLSDHLRFGFIAGQAGVVLSSLIIVLCVASTLPTALSMTAVATNGKVGGGGGYFIVSRNMGAAAGGAIGLLFYLGTSIAVW